MRLIAALAGLLLLSCSGTEPPVAPSPPPAPLSFQDALRSTVVDPIQQLAIPTYDGSGENVHPDILSFSEPWHGWPCWLVFTPYRGSDVSLENPSIVASNDCVHWQEIEGVTNPVVDPPGGAAYNSDPDHAFDAELREVVTLHRVVAADSNRILISTSGDGRARSRPRLAFAEPNHHAVSPALVISADRVGRVWYVDAGTGCSTVASSVKLRTARPLAGQSFRDATWSAPEQVELRQPGYVIWHIDVVELPRGMGFLALYAAFPASVSGSRCSQDDDFLAWSTDGKTWKTFNMPILWRGMAGMDLTSFYRGTLAYDASRDLLRVWVSGLDPQHSWWSFYVSYRWAALRRVLERASLQAQSVLAPYDGRLDAGNPRGSMP